MANPPFNLSAMGRTLPNPAPRTETTSEPRDRLIVGVDFGTTYSGVAVAYSGLPTEIDIIKTWPGGNGITSDKVPTEIAYEASQVSVNPTVPPSVSADGKGHQIKWGFQFRPEDSRLRCIKLFLDRSQKLPPFVSPVETASSLRSHNRTVQDAVSDYLAAIHAHTLETLTRRYGESFMKGTPIEWVLTVPAVWSDAAKHATLAAAEKAGMGSSSGRESSAGQVRLISEPEAAAVYTLKAMGARGLQVGDNFVVCDAGGGTVDLIAYKITNLNPLKVEEAVVGFGGLCGSAFLNLRFEEHVRKRIGEELWDRIRNKKPKTWSIGVKYWEEFVKRNFNEDSQEFNIPFPGLPDDEEANIDSGFLIMTRDQVKDIFDPIIKDVISLVEGQINGIRAKGGVVSGIILVGGFGQSSYLYHKMKSHFNSAPPPPYTERPTHEVALAPRAPDQIEVMQPMYAWTAVVRGAVLRGLEGSMVVNRRSRWHYGTSYATVYDETKHSLDDRYWSPLWERWMVSDRMQYHIAKGAPVSEETPISFHYTRNFRPGQSLVVEDDLIACDADEAPESFSKSLIKVCTLTTDLSQVPRSLFTRLTTTKGVEFENLDFTLVMRIMSAQLVFELCVDGVRYGTVSAKFY